MPVPSMLDILRRQNDELAQAGSIAPGFADAVGSAVTAYQGNQKKKLDSGLQRVGQLEATDPDAAAALMRQLAPAFKTQNGIDMPELKAGKKEVGRVPTVQRTIGEGKAGAIPGTVDIVPGTAGREYSPVEMTPEGKALPTGKVYAETYDTPENRALMRQLGGIKPEWKNLDQGDTLAEFVNGAPTGRTIAGQAKPVAAPRAPDVQTFADGTSRQWNPQTQTWDVLASKPAGTADDKAPQVQTFADGTSRQWNPQTRSWDIMASKPAGRSRQNFNEWVALNVPEGMPEPMDVEKELARRAEERVGKHPQAGDIENTKKLLRPQVQAEAQRILAQRKAIADRYKREGGSGGDPATTADPAPAGGGSQFLDAFQKLMAPYAKAVSGKP